MIGYENGHKMTLSKPTMILFLLAIVCIAIAAAWEHHDKMIYEKSYHTPVIYDLDTQNNVVHSNSTYSVPFLRRAIGYLGWFAFLLAMPLLISDLTRPRHRERT